MSIKQVRKELGLSQSEFARLFGVHQTAVSQWETGRTCPDTDMVIRIARATNHSADEILGIHTEKVIRQSLGRDELIMPDDSMVGVRIRRGDRVYLKEMAEYEPDSLIGVQRNDESTVRFFRSIAGEKYLFDTLTPPTVDKMEKTDRILGLVDGFYVNLDEV